MKRLTLFSEQFRNVNMVVFVRVITITWWTIDICWDTMYSQKDITASADDMYVFLFRIFFLLRQQRLLPYHGLSLICFVAILFIKCIIIHWLDYRRIYTLMRVWFILLFGCEMYKPARQIFYCVIEHIPIILSDQRMQIKIKPHVSASIMQSKHMQRYRLYSRST